MTIAWLNPRVFIGAIIVGLVLSFAIAAITTPHPVEQPVVVITPVPTPQPVYITPEPTKITIPATMAPLPTSNEDKTFNKVNTELNDSISSAFSIISISTIALLGIMIISIIGGLFGIVRNGGDE